MDLSFFRLFMPSSFLSSASGRSSAAQDPHQCMVSRMACLLLHYVALALPDYSGLRGDLRSLLGTWAVQLCGLFFMAAASEARISRPKQLILAELALPILLGEAWYVFDLHNAAIRIGTTLLLAVPAFHLFFWPRDRTPSFNYLAAAFALIAVTLSAFTIGHPVVVMLSLLCAIYVAAGCLTLTYAPRMSIGLALVVGGLIFWGLSFPVQRMHLLPASLSLEHAILDLPVTWSLPV